MTYIPVDPIEVLPPDSLALLPTAVPRQAMIGMCDCGEAGCGSLWLQVRRTGDVVVWEPDPRAQWASVDSTWTFELRQYLDAVDAGQRSTQAWETRPRLLARELRRRRDSLFGLGMIDKVGRAEVILLDARAWPGDDEVVLWLATRDGRRNMRVPVPADRSDKQVLNALTVVDPECFD